MTATLQDSQKEKESNTNNNDNNSESITTILVPKKMMSKIKKHVIEDNCDCCLKGP